MYFSLAKNPKSFEKFILENNSLMFGNFWKKVLSELEDAGETVQRVDHIKHDTLLKFIDFLLFLKTTSKRYPLPRHA